MLQLSFFSLCVVHLLLLIERWIIMLTNFCLFCIMTIIKDLIFLLFHIDLRSIFKFENMGKCVRYGVINGCDESLVKCVLNYSMYLLQCYL